MTFEENMKIPWHGLGFSGEFFSRTPKHMEPHRNQNQIKILSALKGKHEESENDDPQNGNKIFANLMPDKGLAVIT